MTALFSHPNSPERQAWGVGGGDGVVMGAWGAVGKRQRGGSFEGELGELKMAGVVKEAR